VQVNQFKLISLDRINFSLHSMEITFEMHVDLMMILHLLINEAYCK
jgi:hypothetical protein